MLLIVGKPYHFLNKHHQTQLSILRIPKIKMIKDETKQNMKLHCEKCGWTSTDKSELTPCCPECATWF